MENYNDPNFLIGDTRTTIPGGENFGPVTIDQKTIYSGKPVSFLLRARWNRLAKILVDAGVPLSAINQDPVLSVLIGARNGTIKYVQ